MDPDTGTSNDCNSNGIPDECPGEDLSTCDSAVAGGGSFSDPDTHTSGTVPDADTNYTIGDESGTIAAVAGDIGTIAGQTTVDLDIDAEIATLRIFPDGTLNVTSEGVGDLTVNQAGGILNKGGLFLAHDRVIDASAGAITIGAGGVLQADVGAVDPVSASILAESVTVNAGTLALLGGEIDLSGSMSISTGDFLLDGTDAFTCPAPGSIATIAGGRTSPILRFRDSSRMTVSGDFVIRKSSELIVGLSTSNGANIAAGEQSPEILLGGDFVNESNAPCLFDWSAGKLTMNGSSPQRFEVAGRDLGATIDGLNTEGDSNFFINTLEIAPGSNVTFSNEFRNIDDVGQVAGTSPIPDPCTEALYVGTLILGANATATLSNTVVYYAILEDDDGNVSVIGCGALIQLPTCQTDEECASDTFCNVGSTCAFPPQSPIGLCIPGSSPCEESSVCNIMTESCEALDTLALPRPRYLSFPIPSASANDEAAIRVRLVSLNGFAGMENEFRWVGPPAVYPDEPDALFIASALQCEPHFQNWSSVGILNVLGAAVVPSSVYEVQFVESSCPSLDDESCFTDPVTITTGAWGDVTAPFFVEGGQAQPDFQDIAGLVDKFQSLPSAPPKVRAQLQPSVPDPSIPDFPDGLTVMA